MQKVVSFCIDKFAEKFNQEYNFLYDNHDNVAGYTEAVRAFDEFANEEQNKGFISDFAKYRGDFISSDREAAAFMFAMDSM